MTTFAAGEILEYKHGGYKPIKTLRNPGEYMEGCSVDETTGDLAAIDFEPTSGSSGGGVAIFARASGKPTVLMDPNLYEGYALAYDKQGDLFLDGVDSGGNFEFAELPQGSSTFTEISLGVNISTPGGVNWDGKYVDVGDAKSGEIYQTDGAGGKVEGTTTLSESDGIFQFCFFGKRVIGANLYGANVLSWSYPAGGDPIASISGFDSPFGVVISRKAVGAP